MDFAFDTSDIDEVPRLSERVNGVDSQKITIDDPELAARVFGADEEELKGLEEFTIWLAEDGGWPVAMRMVISNGRYPFISRDEEAEKQVPDWFELPPEVLESYQYGFIVAAERESAAATDQNYHTEFTFAISRVNAAEIAITPPR